jgi:hypothetical protein
MKGPRDLGKTKTSWKETSDLKRSANLLQGQSPGCLSPFSPSRKRRGLATKVTWFDSLDSPAFQIALTGDAGVRGLGEP